MRSFLIDGRVPAAWRIALAVRLGRQITIGVLPEGTDIESMLWPVKSSVRELLITVGAPNTDYSFLEHFDALEYLEIWSESTNSVDLSDLPLTSFACRPYSCFQSIVNNRTIKTLRVENGGLAWLPHNGQLEELQLYCKQKALDLIELESQKRLKRLDLAGSKSLDLEPLANLEHLNEIELTNFAYLDNLQVLERLTNLKSLLVEDIGKVSDPLVFDRLHSRGVKVWAIGRTSWSKGVRERVEAQGRARGWSKW